MPMRYHKPLSAHDLRLASSYECPIMTHDLGFELIKPARNHGVFEKSIWEKVDCSCWRTPVVRTSGMIHFIQPQMKIDKLNIVIVNWTSAQIIVSCNRGPRSWSISPAILQEESALLAMDRNTSTRSDPMIRFAIISLNASDRLIWSRSLIRSIWSERDHIALNAEKRCINGTELFSCNVIHHADIIEKLTTEDLWREFNVNSLVRYLFKFHYMLRSIVT